MRAKSLENQFYSGNILEKKNTINISRDSQYTLKNLNSGTILRLFAKYYIFPSSISHVIIHCIASLT